MSYKRKNLEDRITEALKNCASSFLHPGSGRWELSLANGKELPVTMRLAEDWLLFDAPVSDRLAREDLWRVLRLNATLSGFCKLSLLPPATRDLAPRRSVHLRAEVPLRDEEAGVDAHDTFDGNLEAALSETCANLKAAYGLFCGEEPAPALTAPALTTAQVSIRQFGESEDCAEALRRVCAELEWPVIERTTGRFMFELEVRDNFQQAVAEQQNAGARLSIEISRFDDLAPISRQALSALLLITGAHVRLARPSVDENATAGFEVTFGTLPTVSEFKHALSSLSVASATCAREAVVLRNEHIARQYLAYTGLAEGTANLSFASCQ